MVVWLWYLTTPAETAHHIVLHVYLIHSIFKQIYIYTQRTAKVDIHHAYFQHRQKPSIAFVRRNGEEKTLVILQWLSILFCFMSSGPRRLCSVHSSMLVLQSRSKHLRIQTVWIQIVVTCSRSHHTDLWKPNFCAEFCTKIITSLDFSYLTETSKEHGTDCSCSQNSVFGEGRGSAWLIDLHLGNWCGIQRLTLLSVNNFS